MAEKFVFKNLDDLSRTESFTNLSDDELHELIEAAIGSEYCSTTQILLGLHRWVNTAEDDARVNTFFTLVNKLQRHQIDEKVFAEIFLDDHRLKDDARCRAFRDEYLSDFFKKHIERGGSSSSSDPHCTPERGTKLKLEDVEEEEARKRVVAKDELQEPLVAIEEKVNCIESTPSTSAQQPTDSSPSAQKPSVSSPRAQQPFASSPRAQQLPVSSPRAQQLPVSSLRAHQPARSTSAHQAKIISGGNGSDCIEYFTSKQNDQWIIGSFNLATGDVEKITDLPCYREDGALIHAYNHLYFIGGRLDGEVSAKIDVFDMIRAEWITQNLRQLNEAREDFQRCVCDGCIIIIGGNRSDGSDIDSAEHIPLYGTATLPQQEDDFDEDDDSDDDIKGRGLYSLQGEIYHTATGKWTDIPKIPISRTGHATTVYQSKFYVFGGVRTGVYSFRLASACVYDPKTNAWTMLPNMLRKRYHAAAVIHSKYIYIIGGDGDGASRTIEKFDPTKNRFTLIENWLDKLPKDVNFYVMTEKCD